MGAAGSSRLLVDTLKGLDQDRCKRQWKKEKDTGVENKKTEE